jgi:hypothetical protein
LGYRRSCRRRGCAAWRAGRDRASDVGRTCLAVVAARKQCGAWRRRSRPHATRDGRGAGGTVARAAQHGRPGGAQLRSAAPRRPGLQA